MSEISLIDKPGTAERFVKIFQGVHGVEPGKAAQMFEVEKFSFLRTLSEKAIIEVSEVSKMGVFLDVISNGLSFSGQMQHVYMMARKVKTGKKENGKDVYESRLTYSLSPDGRIFMAQKAGSIQRVTKPVIVYEGDDFGVGTRENGEPTIIHKPVIPRKSNKIVAGYVYIVFPDGAREPYWMQEADIERLKGYSARNNKKWDDGARKFVSGDPNALYTSGVGGGIDEGFFGAKLINFALKNIRRAGMQGVHEVVDAEFEYVPDTPSPDFTPDTELNYDNAQETF